MRPQLYETRLLAGEAFVLVAREDGDPISFACVVLAKVAAWSRTDHVAGLETLSVLPTASGKAEEGRRSRGALRRGLARGVQPAQGAVPGSTSGGAFDHDGRHTHSPR